jgi:carboxypeptidase C (cathepsin A)
MTDQAQEKSTPAAEKPAETPKDDLVITQHSVTIGGQVVPYSVTCGTIVLKEESEAKGDKEGEAEGEKPKATIFFIAYTRDGELDPARRPVTFSFNGGPGSSSVWLHLGALGPRRVEMGDAGSLLPPPWQLVDNTASLLDVTDLVFIDPVSTGYSRPVVGEKAKQFHGFKRDIESVGDFIRLYTSRYHRWSSPKFLIGESYGTTRAAGLSSYLQERYGMYLNGLMLVSAILNFQGYEFDPGNDLPYITHLPTYAATAWYHQQLSKALQSMDLTAFLAEVQAFSLGEYNLALTQGAALPSEQRGQIVQKLASYTGLSEEYIERCNLRVEIHRFVKELLRSRRRAVGRLDTRFLGIDRDSAGEHYEHDPSMSAILGPYTAAFNQYVRAELKFEKDLPYEILNFKVWPWSYAEHENRYLDVAEPLRKAMSVNPFLKVFVANGYYDLATPFAATEYTFNHLGLDPELQPNLSMAYYPAGHMMYVHLPSLARLKDDLAAFINSGWSNIEG